MGNSAIMVELTDISILNELKKLVEEEFTEATANLAPKSAGVRKVGTISNHFLEVLMKNTRQRPFDASSVITYEFPISPYEPEECLDDELNARVNNYMVMAGESSLKCIQDWRSLSSKLRRSPSAEEYPEISKPNIDNLVNYCAMKKHVKEREERMGSLLEEMQSCSLNASKREQKMTNRIISLLNNNE